MKQSLNLLIFILVVIQSLLYILFFPNLDNPDVPFHAETIYNSTGDNESLYYKIMSDINEVVVYSFGIDDYQQYNINDEFNHFNWQTLNDYENYNSINIVILQLVNLFFVIISIILFKITLNRTKIINSEEHIMLFRLCLLYYLYPAVSYLIIGITPDLFGYLFQPFFILFIYLKNHFKNMIFCVLLFIFMDEGIILNMYFLIIYIAYSNIFKGRLKNSNLIMSLFSLTSIACIYIFVTKILVNISNNSMIITMQYVRENYGVVYTKIINLFISSFAFPGSGSFITFPPLYLLYGMIVLIILLKIVFGNKKENHIMKIAIQSSFITIISTILIIPPYSHIRFYLFFIIFLIWSGFTVLLNDMYLKSDKKYLQISILFFVHNVLLLMAISYYSWN